MITSVAGRKARPARQILPSHRPLEQRMLPKKFGTQQGRGETSLFPIVALGD